MNDLKSQIPDLKSSKAVKGSRGLGKLFPWLLVLPALLFASWTHADEPGAAAAFSVSDAQRDDALRLIRKQCFGCHDEDKKKGGLILTSRDSILKGSSSGSVVEPGDPGDSYLLTMLPADAETHMPPKGQLTAEEIQWIADWIRAGLPWNDEALKGPLFDFGSLVQTPPHESYRPVLAMAVHPKDERLAVARGSEVSLYDITQKDRPLLQSARPFQGEVRSLEWSRDGEWLAAGGFRELTLWRRGDIENPGESIDGFQGRITALAFGADASLLFVADGLDGVGGWIDVVDLETRNVLRRWEAHGDSIYDLDLDESGLLLASAGGDHRVKIWETATFQLFGVLEGHSAQVMAVAFNQDGSQLASGGLDTELKVWDVARLERQFNLGRHSVPFQGLAWNRKADAVFAVNERGDLYRYTDLKDHSGVARARTAKEKRLGNLNEFPTVLQSDSKGETLFAGTHVGDVLIRDQDGKSLGVLPVEAAKAPAAENTPPSFLMDVLPMMGKAGCSAGSCHAKPKGQNGFHLSIFAYDPESDYREIVKDARGRRVFPSAPEASMLLLKPTLSLPHEGGEVIARDSDSYRLLKEWIGAGMPYRNADEPDLVEIQVKPEIGEYHAGDERALKVSAHYSDGSARDVTALTQFASGDKEVISVDEGGKVVCLQSGLEGVVTARYMGHVAKANFTIASPHRIPEQAFAELSARNFIDRLAYAQFKKLGLFPSELCSDAEFIRRASLCAIGALPSAAEARAFLADPNPGKREAWIERLLGDRRYGDYWANRWADLFRPNPDRVGVKSVYVFDQWLRRAFRENTPYDRFASEILTHEGSNHGTGPAVIYRDRREPEELTTMFGQIFLGVRLECAKCHHHPFEKWSQKDFYQTAAFFGRLKQKGKGLSPPISAGQEWFYTGEDGQVKHPVTDAALPPMPPGETNWETEPEEDPRRAFAKWILERDNPYFARALVNRVWAVYFGRGFVEPVDDFRSSNPPSNEPLLNALADCFVENGYDMKQLMRTIMRSRLFQLSSLPNDTNVADTRNFSRYPRSRLPAETLLDAVCDITGIDEDFGGLPAGSRATQAWTFKIDSHFMDAFSRPNSSSDPPCERDELSSVTQSLHLMNSSNLQEKLSHSDGWIRELADSGRSPQAIVEEIYLAAYSRYPKPEELDIALKAFSGEDANRREAAEDVLWALMNSAEFVFNH